MEQKFDSNIEAAVSPLSVANFQDAKEVVGADDADGIDGDVAKFCCRLMTFGVTDEYFKKYDDLISEVDLIGGVAYQLFLNRLEDDDSPVANYLKARAEFHLGNFDRYLIYFEKAALQGLPCAIASSVRLVNFGWLRPNVRVQALGRVALKLCQLRGCVGSEIREAAENWNNELFSNEQRFEIDILPVDDEDAAFDSGRFCLGRMLVKKSAVGNDFFGEVVRCVLFADTAEPDKEKPTYFAGRGVRVAIPSKNSNNDSIWFTFSNGVDIRLTREEVVQAAVEAKTALVEDVGLARIIRWGIPIIEASVG